MYKIIKADKDAYITDRVVDGERMTSANVGAAGSLDLFKLYGFTSSGSNPNIELSRLLVHFNLDPVRDLISTNKIDVTNSSFACTLKLFDVNGGQPLPRNFKIVVHPLARSFDEGLGRDVVLYGDSDSCNFLSGSRSQGAWILSGANSGGGSLANVDYITSIISEGITSSLEMTQTFTLGNEDLSVDVTKIISASLASIIPDEGFRIALTSSLENDHFSYFVKRFAARTAYNSDKRPQLIVRFDDSIQDDTNELTFDSFNTIFLYNYVQGRLQNLYSASTMITGSSSLVLKLQTEISGGFYDVMAFASQHKLGNIPVNGVYSASIMVSSTTPEIVAKLAQSSSIKFTPIWRSLDDTVSYLTGSNVFIYPSDRGSMILEPKSYIVTITGIKPEFVPTESTTLRVNIFDASSPKLFKVKTPVITPGVVVRDVFYSIRDQATDQVMIPFDQVKNSTRVSADSVGMYFKLDVSNLTPGRAYIVDILINTNDNEQIYRGVSSVFRVSNLT
jgi:hypothetical protein